MTAQLTTAPDNFVLSIPLAVSATAAGVRLTVKTASRGEVVIRLDPSDLCGLMEMYGQVAADEVVPVVRFAE